MSDTSDFLARVRSNDKVAIIKEAANGDMLIIHGIVQRNWSTGAKYVLDDTGTFHMLTDHFGKIADNLMSIRFRK